MPELAAEQRERAADQRYFTVDHQQVSFAGTSRLHGELDLADALDVEDAVTALAQRFADLGSTDTLEARRAAALGMLARGSNPSTCSRRACEVGVLTGAATESKPDGPRPVGPPASLAASVATSCSTSTCPKTRCVPTA